MNCLFCSALTENDKFCSRSCSTSFTNKTNPRRKKTKQCEAGCGTYILSSRKYCRECGPAAGVDNNVTIKSVTYTKGHKSSAFALIRSRARSVMREEPRICEVCGYSKHVEVAHIKSISSFSEDTLLSIVNDKSNLKLLCPNCHWEFDNGLLEIHP